MKKRLSEMEPNLATHTHRILVPTLKLVFGSQHENDNKESNVTKITVWELHRVLVIGLVPPRKNSIELLQYGNLVLVNTSTKLPFTVNSSILFFLGGTSPNTNIRCLSHTVKMNNQTRKGFNNRQCLLTP